MAFETPTVDLTGSISATVHEHEGVQPSTIIKVGDHWSVHVNWEMVDEDGGDLWRMVAGHWHVHVNLESIGPGPEISLYEFADSECHWQELPSADGTYSCHFDVPGNVIQDAWDAAMPGQDFPHQGLPMKMLVMLSYYLPSATNILGERGEIAAYQEGPVLQFYLPG